MHGGYNYKKVARILKDNGWTDEGQRNGGHRKFEKNGKHIAIPWGRDINIMLFNRLCKENGICK